jgi:hypothetical protein
LGKKRKKNENSRKNANNKKIAKHLGLEIIFKIILMNRNLK